MSSERARVMIMGQKEKEEITKLSRSQEILNVIEADEKPWQGPMTHEDSCCRLPQPNDESKQLPSHVRIS
jgi:hypothetical protein